MIPAKLDDFLEATGYSSSDVLVYNSNTGAVVTKNGGNYRITETGKILHLGGPSSDPTERV
jgi:hypothetical protein